METNQKYFYFFHKEIGICMVIDPNTFGFC
jgi:hypothetical protein